MGRPATRRELAELAAEFERVVEEDAAAGEAEGRDWMGREAAGKCLGLIRQILKLYDEGRLRH